MKLLDLQRLSSWLDTHSLQVGQPITATPLDGGTSHAMFVVSRGDARWVLRRPAGVAVARANEGICREYRILGALAETAVPHPRVVALCQDHEVLGCTFFLMEHVDGVSADSFDGELGASVAFAMVDELATLHNVDWRAAGLGDLGHPEHFHERQVQRWTAQLLSYGDRRLPNVDDVCDWLRSNPPNGFSPTVMHGDYHMRNVLVGPGSPPKIAAILDWETATVGDPLLDLAGLCEIIRFQAPEGWPADSALIDRYRSARPLTEIGDLTYYAVLYNFRLAVLLEGVYRRSLQDSTRSDQDTAGLFALRMMQRAHELTQIA